LIPFLLALESAEGDEIEELGDALDLIRPQESLAQSLSFAFELKVIDNE